MIIDFALVILASFIGHWLRFGSLQRFQSHFWEVLVAAILLIIIFRFNKLYTNFRGKISDQFWLEYLKTGFYGF